MSIATLIIGESGTGKSCSLRNLSANDCLVIQSIKKPLPFKSSEFKHRSEQHPTGNVFVTDNSDTIVTMLHKTQKKIIIIDDFQYLMANEFMRRSSEKGFEKFTEIAKHAHDIVLAATQLPDDVRVYILSHSESTDAGNTKCKTIGRLLDEKITLEGIFTIVLKTGVEDGKYFFTTQNNGKDTVKSPMGLFDANRIDNDLKAIDESIFNYYK
jgi:hypothetical protein